MIAEYDENGRIFHIVKDPVPQGLGEAMAKLGKVFVDAPPIPREVHDRDPKTGEFLYEEVERADGQTEYAPVMITVHDFVKCRMATHFVSEGRLAKRPTIALTVSVEGRKVALGGIPAGAAVRLTLDPETDLQVIETLEATDEPLVVELDEPSLLRFDIRPPWPFQEVVHDLEVE